MEFDCFKEFCELFGLGILLFELVVLDPDPCLDLDLSLKADVRVWGITGGPPPFASTLPPTVRLLGDRALVDPLFGFFGGFLSPTSISTITGFPVKHEELSSLVNVPCLTNLEEFALEVVELALLIVLGAGEANGALPLGIALLGVVS